MAHFAKLDEAGTVTEVIVVANAELLEGGQESEDKGIAFLIEWSGGHQAWKQTSYSGSIRKNYAAVGYAYDAQRDAFIPPKPSPDAVLDESTCRWVTPQPEVGATTEIQGLA